MWPDALFTTVEGVAVTHLVKFWGEQGAEQHTNVFLLNA